MANDVFLVDRSFVLNRLFGVSTNNVDFPGGAMQPRATEPGTLMDQNGVTEQGVITISDQDVDIAPRLIWLQPFCDGGPGQVFYMNVWGWTRCGTQQATVVWAPVFLAQIQCVSANIFGPAPQFPPSKLLLTETECLCDTLTLNAGTVGTGQIQSPQNDYSGFVEIDAQGCHKVQVEFATLGGGSFGMNALWRPA